MAPIWRSFTMFSCPETMSWIMALTSSSLKSVRFSSSAIFSTGSSGFLETASIKSFKASLEILLSSKSLNVSVSFSFVNMDTSTPSRLKSLRSETRTEATVVESTFNLAMSSSKRSARSLLTSWLERSSESLYSLMILASFSSGSSGRLFFIGSTMSSVIWNNGMSVSRYILFAVGRGLMYSVFPSSKAFLVSSTTPSNAISALLMVSFNAFTATSSSCATMMIASSGPVLR